MDANGAIIVTDTIEQAIDLSNLYAPEHLCLMVQDSENDTLTWSRNAGALFLGDHSPHVSGRLRRRPEPRPSLPQAPPATAPPSASTIFSSPPPSSLSPRSNRLLSCPTELSIARQEGFESHARSLEVRTPSSTSVTSSQRLNHGQRKISTFHQRPYASRPPSSGGLHARRPGRTSRRRVRSISQRSSCLR